MTRLALNVLGAPKLVYSLGSRYTNMDVSNYRTLVPLGPSAKT